MGRVHTLPDDTGPDLPVGDRARQCTAGGYEGPHCACSHCAAPV